MKKFVKVTGITGIVCIVLGVIVITVAAAAGGSLAGTFRRGYFRIHDIFESRTEWEIGPEWD